MIGGGIAGILALQAAGAFDTEERSRQGVQWTVHYPMPQSDTACATSYSTGSPCMFATASPYDFGGSTGR